MSGIAPPLLLAGWLAASAAPAAFRVTLPACLTGGSPAPAARATRARLPVIVELPTIAPPSVRDEDLTSRVDVLQRRREQILRACRATPAGRVCP